MSDPERVRVLEYLDAAEWSVWPEVVGTCRDCSGEIYCHVGAFPHPDRWDPLCGYDVAAPEAPREVCAQCTDKAVAAIYAAADPLTDPFTVERPEGHLIRPIPRTRTEVCTRFKSTCDEPAVVAAGAYSDGEAPHDCAYRAVQERLAVSGAAHPARGLRLRVVVVPPRRYHGVGWVLFGAPSGGLEGLPQALSLGVYLEVAERRLGNSGRRFYTAAGDLVLTVITDAIGRSPSRTNATASALNSFANRRRVLPGDGVSSCITDMTTS